jgi:hypothetical protein
VAVTAEAASTQTATIGTEHTLDDVAAAGTYTLHVDTVNMAAADVLELRVYQIVLTGGTRRGKFHTETDCGLHLALDTTSYSEPRFRVGYLKGVHAYDFSWSQSAVRFDQWVPFSIDVNWSYGSDGSRRLSSAARRSSTGLALRSQAGRAQNSSSATTRVRQLRNEVWFEAVRKG